MRTDTKHKDNSAYYICFADGKGTNITINPTNGFSKKELYAYLIRNGLVIISEYKLGPIVNVLCKSAAECQNCGNI